ncbi:MAG: AbrB/MazE/SpoVT family DNA-binding domain-containing protein [Nitrospirae bacterium]|nr:AbrB/MazE/SpoVT family DNA-binding domain-containing protein [Nitrospirota bacterium]
MATGVVGERGQITIPKDIRKRLGIKPKTSVVMEVTPEGLLIHPTITVKIRSFSAEFIDETAGKDIIRPGEREKILGKWRK